MILNVEHLTHGFGDRAIFEDVSFRLLKGEHIGLVGANGEGKSTFMNIVTGKLASDEGKVEWNKNVRVGYLDQHAVLQKGMTIESVLKSAFNYLFDMEKQFQILADACRRIGLNTENPDFSGLTIDGQPFSFSTSYVSGIRSLHHGTMKLTACCSSVTAETMENSLLQAFENQYGLSAEPISAEALDFAVITSYEKIFRDDSWINGQE